MDGLLVIAALVVLAIPVTLILLVIGQSGLRSRLTEAEREISRMQADMAKLDLGTASETPLAETEAPLPETDEMPEKAATSTAPPLPKSPPKAAMAQSAPPPVARAEPRPQSPIAKALTVFGPWLQENWFYAVSAASLALAGIFLV